MLLASPVLATPALADEAAISAEIAPVAGTRASFTLTLPTEGRWRWRLSHLALASARAWCLSGFETADVVWTEAATITEGSYSRPGFCNR